MIEIKEAYKFGPEWIYWGWGILGVFAGMLFMSHRENPHCRSCRKRHPRRTGDYICRGPADRGK